MTDGAVPTVNPAWRTHQIEITLPIGLVRSMFDRARKWSRAEGGRFDPGAETVVLWSGPPCSASAHPIGSFGVRWRTPTESKATIYTISWDDRNGGSLGEICRAVEILAGSLVAS